MPPPNGKFSTIRKRGKPLPWQAREIIANVIDFFKKESHFGPAIPINNYEARAIQATGVSEQTFHNIIMEAKRIETGEIPGFKTPIKTIRTTKKTINPAKAKILRELVHNLYIIEKRPPTVHSLMAKIKAENIEFDGNITALWSFMRKIGFRLVSTRTNRKAIVESCDIRYKRMYYLQQLLEYRQQNRPIVYVNESYIDSSHIHEISRISPDKNNRLYLLHAVGEMGFLPKCLLMSTSESNNNQDDGNSRNFVKWIEKKLIPNLPQRCVLIIDSATYHNIKLEQLTYAKKDMMAWLDKRNVPYNMDMTKPELYYLIRTYKSQNSTYKLDELLGQYGHNVLRLPNYHPELSPMENIWDIVKNWVTMNSVTFKIRNVKDLVRQKCNTITKNDCLQYCEDVKKIESDYIEKEDIFDTITDELEIPIEDNEIGDKDDQLIDDIMELDEISDDELEETISTCSKPTSPAKLHAIPIKEEINDDEPIEEINDSNMCKVLKQENNDDEITEINEEKPAVYMWNISVKELDSEV